MTLADITVPAHLRPYVETLGVDLAIDFLLSYGGGVAYFSTQPNPQSPIAQAVGVERAGQLARALGGGSMRVPTAKPYIARILRAKGFGTSQIARKLHASNVAVRGWLTEDDPRQLTLFGS